MWEGSHVGSRKRLSRSTSSRAFQNGIVEPQPSDSEEEEADDDQSTSLHSAVKNGSIAVIKRLLNRGADSNEQDERLWTPLYKASKA